MFYYQRHLNYTSGLVVEYIFHKKNKNKIVGRILKYEFSDKPLFDANT